MPLEVRREHDERIVYARATGPTDWLEWAQLTEQHGRAADTRLLALIMDVRGREGAPSPDQARSICDVLGQWGAVAIVAQPGVQFGMARVTDTISELQGIPVRAFTDLDEALTWATDQMD